MKRFSSRIIAWQHQYGRHALPWQIARDPYHIWLSEIMLQQTQVATVIPYFVRFVERFPNLRALSSASENEVLVMWSGLGYYSRARNLLKAARCVMRVHGGELPQTPSALESLPGIGRSTAAAIAALAFGKTHAILDGNVRRVLARHAGITGWPGEKAIEDRLWALAESLLPKAGIEAYTQGMMDMGASLCTRTRPDCAACPVSGDCVALREGRVTDIPAARPKKALPERHSQMLLLVNRSQILLEKRPPRGIWGGLWSFPELVMDIDAVQHCETQLGLTVTESIRMPTFSHVFTHFRLHIAPLVVRVGSRSGQTPDGQCWLGRDQALEAALPAPVRKLLLRLDDSADSSILPLRHAQI